MKRIVQPYQVMKRIAVSGDEVLYEGDIELSNVENINMTGEEVDTLRAALNPTDNYEGLNFGQFIRIIIVVNINISKRLNNNIL